MAIAREPERPSWIAWIFALVVCIGALVLVWWKFFTTDPETPRAEAEWFKYGSLGNELLTGIPYPIFMVLPRVFPDLVEKYAKQGWGPDKRGHGGYGAFGFAWEEGERLPVGFSIARLGFDRVTVNCALCHITPYRLQPEEKLRFALGGAGHSVDMQGFLRFLFAAARDRRFSATRLLPEMVLQFDMDAIDKALYFAVLIPTTRLALNIAEGQMAWMDRKPAWGPGRDDAFNLPKYVLTQSAWDDTVGNTDFPALWRMGDRDGHLMHWGGEARSVAGVIASSAFGMGSLPFGGFEQRNARIEAFLRGLEPPPFPGAIDAALVARGRAIFEAQCASCHAKGGARTGKAIPVAEIGTDPEHVNTWRQPDADRMNWITRLLGASSAEMQGAQGYVARPLVGLWLLGPYLHNGSVPTLADLLTPPAQRPVVFHRGYEIVDLDRVGFVSSGRDAEAKGFRFDTRLKGNGNSGHAYGTDLPVADKRALLEYLKTL
jgi:uncharacterized membrane protein YedE/YeeE